MSELAGGKLRLDRPAPHVARLTIDNPAKRNALDHEILEAIASTVRELDDARCLLLTGVGPVFSAGYDIGGLPRGEFAHRAESLVAHPFHAAIEAVEAFPYPAVAALNGHAIGGGLELALTCDLRMAATGAKLGMPPARLGLVYSHTGLRKFIDAVGVARTRELFFTARNVSAAVALEWGLVTELAPPEKLAERAVAFAAEIGANAPLSLAGNKREISELAPPEKLAERAVAFAAEIAANAPLSLSGNKRVISELLAAEGRLDPEVEAELVALREACFRSEDFYEGVRAFSEKRAPEWQGR